MLLDLNMPKINGQQVLSRIQDDHSVLDMRTIVLTTSSHEADILQSYSLGASSYLTKPVDTDQFFSAIKLPPETDRCGND